jgi:Major Facilitator Superfamily
LSWAVRYLLLKARTGRSIATLHRQIARHDPRSGLSISRSSSSARGSKLKLDRNWQLLDGNTATAGQLEKKVVSIGRSPAVMAALKIDTAAAASPCQTPVGSTSTSRERSPSAFQTPLPKMQVFLIAASNFINAVSYLVNFPSVPFLVLHFDPSLTKEEAGYRSGYLEGSFHLGQFFGAFAWAWFSDRYGRKPALQWGLLWTAVFCIAFGMSPSFPVAIVIKIMWGLANGNVGVAKTALSELTDDSNTAKAFSYIGVATGAGRIVGPVIGGFLSQPATKYPKIFSQDGFFGKYPFVLPNLIVAVITIVAFLLGSIYMIETRPAGLRGRKTAETKESKPKELELSERSEAAPVTKAGALAAPDLEDNNEAEEEEQDEEEVSLIASASAAATPGRSKPLPIEDEDDEDSMVEPGTTSKDKAKKGEGEGEAKEKKKSRKAQAIEDELELDLDRPLPSTKNAAAASRCRPSCPCCSGLKSYFSMLTKVLKDPAVKSSTGLYTSLAAIGLAATELFPVWLVSNPKQGGFGWGSQQVGILVAIAGPCLMVCIKPSSILGWQRSLD